MMLQNIKGSALVNKIKELKEFDTFVKQIGECKSKQEEDRIITREVEVLKQRLNDPKLDKSRGKEYMIRLIYCELLGHDVSFAYVKALQFASDTNLLTKKAAYLAISLFFDHTSELVLLLVNTMLSDMKSDNYLTVCTGLVAVTRMIGPDLINAVYPVVVELLKHPKEHVRKKAIMALHRFYQMDPTKEGPLAGVDIDRHFRAALCDKDPSVMSAALCALSEAVKRDPKMYKNLVPSLTSILKQVVEHRLPKTYDYHKFPAPFLQIKLLKLLSLLGEGDMAASENMYAVVHQTLKRSNNSHTIGNAIIYECVRTITTIYPNPTLLSYAAESVTIFLKSPTQNLRYVGVDALAGIVKINPKYVVEHQLAVIDCLEDPDDTLRLQTLELLYKMTKANNVVVIVQRMMAYLRNQHDEHTKRDVVRKVSELAERYAPDPRWFIGVMSELFELAGEYAEVQLGHNLMRLIAEQEEDLHKAAVEIYLGIVDKPKLSDVVMQVMIWVLGEYGYLAPSLPSRSMSPQQVIDKLVGLMASQKPSDEVRGLLLTAVTKICASTGVAPTQAVQDYVHKCTMSQVVELQQRAYELQALLASSPSLLSDVLPKDASCEEFDENEIEQVRSLTFLTSYVADALSRGAAPYIPPQHRGAKHTSETEKPQSSLKFEAYQPAAPPSPALQHNTPPYPQLIPSTAAPSPHPQHAHAYDMGSIAAALPGQQWQVQGDFTAASASPSGAPVLGGASGGPSSQPQLLLRAAAGRGKWGPAQYASHAEPPRASSTPPHLPSTSSTSTSTSSAHTPAVSGQFPAAPQQQQAPAPQPPPQPPRPPTEKERLAASLFGGGSDVRASYSGSGMANPKSRKPSPGSAQHTTQPHSQTPPQSSIDLLGLDADAPSSTLHSSKHGSMDNLLGLDAILQSEPAPIPILPYGSGSTAQHHPTSYISP